MRAGYLALFTSWRRPLLCLNYPDGEVKWPKTLEHFRDHVNETTYGDLYSFVIILSASTAGNGELWIAWGAGLDSSDALDGV